MEKGRTRYTREFKLETLRLLETSGKTANALEEEMGIGKGCILRWKRKLESSSQNAFPGHGRLTPEQERIRQLERELQIVRQERDILKKQWPSSRTQASEIPVHRRSPRGVWSSSHVQGAGGIV
jgi:transposase